MATLPTTLPILNTVVDQTRTKFTTTFERPIAPGVIEVDDGMAMVSDWSDPTDEKAKPCQGTGNPDVTFQRFLGTAIVGVVNVKQLPLVEEIVAPTVAPAAPVSFALQRTPYVTAPSAFVLYVSGNNTPLTPGGVDYTLTGSTVIVTAAHMGQQLRAVYVYQPTYQEVFARFHQASINMDNVNQLLEQVAIGGGVGSEIYTNFWDSSQGQFVPSGLVYLGDGGRFSAGAVSGSPAIGVVIHAPSADDTTLGFRVTVEA
jgi:hypothetical protein